MRNKNDVSWSLLSFALCFACTTAQQGASGSTSTSPSPGVGPTNASNEAPSTHGVGQAPAPADGARALGAPTASVGVAEVASQSVGAKVTVSGVFMGFNGACLSDAPSRSAWHLAASKEPKAPCVYVDGPFPPGLSPAVHAGTLTTVNATVAEFGASRYLVSNGE